MVQEGFKRKLTAILSADVEGYSRLMGDDEEATVRTLKAYREVLTTLIQQHNGKVLDSQGDNLLAEFASVVDTVQCAVSVQKEINARNAELAEDRRMEFRIGINLGDVIQEEERIYGDGVNIAARLEGLADAGGICISKTAFDHIESKLPYGYEFLGDQTVKNISKPVGAYRVLLEPRVTVAGKPEEEKPAPARRRQIFVGAAAVIVVAVAVGIWQFYMRRSSVESASQEKMAFPLPDKPSIAVLPFVNMSEDPKQEYFCDGMTEDLITDLSKLSGLFVISRNSVFFYKGKAVKPEQVSQELGVRYILEGSVRKAGDRVRITAQLVDATTGGHLWAERYDGKIDNIFSMQDNVTRNIIKALQVRLTKDEQDKTAQAETDSIEAYNNFLKGWGHYIRYTAKDFSEALAYFKKAVEMDPDYGRAYAALALIHKKAIDLGYLSEMGLNSSLAELMPRQYLKLAMRNPTALALNVSADMDLFQRQYREAFLKAKHAISLDPNDAESQAVMAEVLIMDGKPDEALVFVKKAMRLDPHNQARYLYLLGLIRFCMGHVEEAAILIQKAHSLIPEAYLWSGPLAAAYAHLGKSLEARAALKNFVKFYTWYPKLMQAMFYFPFKDPTVADRLAEGLLKAGLQGKTSGYYTVSEEDRLSGEEIRPLVFGRTRSGSHIIYSSPVWKETTENGKIIRRSAHRTVEDAGTSWIENDVLCERFYDLYAVGLEQCGPVFRNPYGSEKLKNEYLWVTSRGIWGWSLAK
jgi:TolB-like protein/class 3 adenylate cyclase